MPTKINSFSNLSDVFKKNLPPKVTPDQISAWTKLTVTPLPVVSGGTPDTSGTANTVAAGNAAVVQVGTFTYDMVQLIADCATAFMKCDTRIYSHFDGFAIGVASKLTAGTCLYSVNKATDAGIQNGKSDKNNNCLGPGYGVSLFFGAD